MSPRLLFVALPAALLALSPGCSAFVSGKGSVDERADKAAPKVPTAAPPKATDAAAAPAPADGSATPAAPADAAKKASDKPVDPLDVAIAAQEGYVYNPIGKRDPFRSFLSTGTTDDDTPRTPLQRYDLDQYNLVGIIWGIDRPRALVEDPEHVGHVLEIGTYIGKNWGKVTQISAGVVVVTEEYQTIDGELVVNEIPMKLLDPTAEAGGKQR